MRKRGILQAFRLSALQPLRTRQELLDYQNLQLRRLVSSSYRSVPYYRRLLDEAGINPNSFRGLEDLESIPTSSKQDLLREPVSATVSHRCDPARLIHHRTNGSTGEPFSVRRSRAEDALLSLFRLRVLRKLGLKPSDKLAALRIPPGDASVRAARWMRRLKMYGCEFVDSTQLPEQIMEGLTKFQPDVVVGLGGPVYLASRTLSISECRAIKPRFFALGGDTLTPGMIRHIEEVFQAPVFAVYGSHEFNLIASHCLRREGLHVQEDGVLLELLEQDRSVDAGEKGEVVATALHSFSQPFIRYRLGDIAVRTHRDCPCGTVFSSLEKIEGRIIDRIILPNGQLLSPDRLFFVVEEQNEWIRQYQLNQPRRDLVRLQLVTSREAGASELIELRQALQKVAGDGLRIEIETVPSISVGPGGKLRLSHSEILSDYLRDQPERCKPGLY